MTEEQSTRLGELCDRLDWDSVKGVRPDIEQILAGAEPDERQRLLEELLRMELDARSSAGEPTTLGEYQERFPFDAELIERVGREVAADSTRNSRRFVGNYELLEEIGRGGEGIVFRALEGGIAPREVAVKLLLPGRIGSREAAQRFLREVRAMARIDHDHIVRYMVSGEDRGQLYYVMRLMQGGNLADKLAGRPEPLDPDEAARLMIQIAEAVHHLHTQPDRIVHRDLKPKNILLDEAGKPYVSDFGLATLLEHDGSVLKVGACGTIPYIAPEQLDPRFGELGPASDIYSMGVILYEVLTGQLPFPRTQESILGTLDRDPLPPSRIRPGIPDALERVCLKCLRKRTSDRYASVAVLAEELARFRRKEALVETPSHTNRQRIRDWAKREPALAARLGVIVACSVILWGYVLVAGKFAPLPPGHPASILRDWRILPGSISVEAILVWTNQIILAAWGAASWAFQRQLTRKREEGGLQLGWRIVDVLAISLVIQLDDALMSPLTVAFAVLIVASAFWARADQILQTMLLSMIGYVVLVLCYRLNHPGLDRPYRHFHYLVALTLLGQMLMHQANRTRALARICGARNRP